MDVFLSYAQADQPLVRRLVEALTESGLNVWWDRDLVGHSLSRAVDQQLRQAKVVVVVWTRESVRSDWVIDEAQQAYKLNKLVPILLGVESRLLPLPFNSLHSVDLSRWSGNSSEPQFKRLLETIKHHAAEEAKPAFGGAAAAAAAAARAKAVQPPPSYATPAPAPMPVEAPGPAPAPMPAAEPAPAVPAVETVAAPPPEPVAVPAGGPAQAGAPDVFVAYSRKDAEICRRVVIALRQQGLDVFYDQFIEGGQEWRESIARSIKSCSVFLVLLSSGSVASAQVRKEVNLATTYTKSIVPVMIENVQLDGGLELELSGINFIAYFDNPEKRLVEVVEKAKTLAAISVFERRRDYTPPRTVATLPGPLPLVSTIAETSAPNQVRTCWLQGSFAVIGAGALSFAASNLLAPALGRTSVEWVTLLAIALFFFAFPYAIAVMLLFRRLLRG